MAAERRLAGTRVWITTDPSQDTYDRYGRLLAYVWVDDDLVNLDLISGVYAAEYIYDQPYRYQDAFQAAESAAREANTGQWGTCGSG